MLTFTVNESLRSGNTELLLHDNDDSSAAAAHNAVLFCMCYFSFVYMVDLMDFICKQ